ncbi:MAG: hypothetical protein KH354_01780 [Clostridiales bacterium]|nr:hypothetical protein [Clostridiales bacterium]
MAKKYIALILAWLIAALCIPAAAQPERQEMPVIRTADNYQLGFTGVWGHMRNLDTIGIEGYYLDTASSTTEPNTGFDYTFTDCTKIYWYANYNPLYVKVDIY